ncbi:MAG TPA: hypothetical protein GYA08_12490 [Chloroflexi bacterium]|nr:hypothetical protein [Chloroflexota bacterium]
MSRSQWYRNSSPRWLALLVILGMLAAFIAAPVQASSGVLQCAAFEDLALGARYVVSNSFASTLQFEVKPFKWLDGTDTTAGYVEVSNGLMAAGSGQELTVNNARVRLLLPVTASTPGILGLGLRFGEYGGNVNLLINGVLQNVENLAALDGMTIGGAVVSVTGGLGNDAGELRVEGAVSSFEIGGQEFFLDDICVVKGEVPPPDGQNRPDLGDAPDSTNHAGAGGADLNNTAYPASGVFGRFPTVWGGSPAGATGPKHVNPHLEAVLGRGLTAEVDAAPPAADQDIINNILAGSADNANNDLGDDGWRNPGAPLVNCQEATLTVRFTRHPASTLERMYLNVWFDGNRDGDWADVGLCQGEQFPGGEARSFEWIIQNFVVNMAALPAGVSSDVPITTKLVFNTPAELDAALHWMRFSLSEIPAIVDPATGLADGRGPDTPNAFVFGETEDYLRRLEQSGQPGELRIAKRAETTTTPVKPGDIFTYTIEIEHVGGTAPAVTVMQDELPAGVVLAGPIQVKELSPSVAPLMAFYSGRTLKWPGSLTPGGKVAITFPVRLERCINAPQVIVNTAVANQTNGGRIQATVETPVECPAAPPIVVHKSIVEFRNNTPVELQEADIVPGMIVRFRFTLVNGGPTPVIVPLRDRLPEGLVTVDEGGVGPIFDKIFRLGPNETKTFDFRAKLVEDMAADGQLVNIGRFIACPAPAQQSASMPPAAAPCTWPADDSPVIRQTNPVTLTVRGLDVGDAPDATNHFAGAAMTAYTGVPAAFATVLDPTVPEQGPAHANPLPFHLGKGVSREANADIGPDADPTNNLLPPVNIANRDHFDDGVAVGRITFSNCVKSEVPVQIFVAPGIAAQLEQGIGYLNIWVDGARDGDWSDVTECPATPNQPATLAFEHIVIDHPINAAALGPGLHTLLIPTTQPVLWPADKAPQPAWLRVTLSDRPANKTLTAGAIAFGDGRGYDAPFRLGETEDYLWRAQQDPANGADLFIRKQGVALPHEEPQGQTGGQPSPGANRLHWVIEYANRGLTTATSVRIADDLTLAGDLASLEVRSTPEVTYTLEGNILRFAVGTLAPGAHGRIVIKMGVPGEGAGNVYTNTVAITADADVDPTNNQAIATITLQLPPPIIVEPGNGTTCDGEIDIRGRALPNAEVDLYLDGALLATVTADASGRWSYSTTVADGDHELYAVARLGGLTSEPSRTVYFTVDSTLIWSPLSLRFTNELGWSHRPVDEEGRTDETGWSLRLRPGSTYTVSVQLCCAAPDAGVQLVISDTQVVEMSDPDGDGVYEGVFTAGDAPRTSAAFRIAAHCGSTSVEGGGVVLIDPEGVVYDVKSAQPLQGTTVACLQSQGAVNGSSADALFSLWPAADFGQVNPQTTAADGYFSFFTPVGAYRLEASRSGYQSYRSTDIQVVDEAVRYDIPLTPQVMQPARHIIQVTEYGFEPAYLTVAPGDVVEWVNMAADGHTATSTKDVSSATVGAASFDSGLLLAGERYQFYFDSAGTFTYFDAVNPANTATIVVSDAASVKVFLPAITR